MSAVPPLDLIPLLPDNFTPLSRTPWGGETIGRDYKHALVPGASGQKIGESWEFSCDPDFPSRVASGPMAGRKLADLVPRDCEILVKLLDAAEPLSVQVHPADDDPHLKPGECGKPESWLVLDAVPGAGLYLGFSRAMGRDELREALHDGDRAKDLLHFEPVRPGDYFEIAPGVPHAIGPGVTLLEPQRVCHGRAGKTYRLWDWGRRYRPDGRPDPVNGRPRELHVEQGLRLVDPERQVGAAFVRTLRRTPTHRTFGRGIVSVDQFPANDYYQVMIGEVRVPAPFTLRIADGYGALTVLAGQLHYGARETGQVLPRGQSAYVPHAASPLTLTAAVGTRFTLVVPAGATVEA